MQKAANGRAKCRVLSNVNGLDLLLKTVSHCHAACNPLAVKKLSVTLVIFLMSPMSRLMSHRKPLKYRPLLTDVTV